MVTYLWYWHYFHNYLIKKTFIETSANFLDVCSKKILFLLLYVCYLFFDSVLCHTY